MPEECRDSYKLASMKPYNKPPILCEHDRLLRSPSFSQFFTPSGKPVDGCLMWAGDRSGLPAKARASVAVIHASMRTTPAKDPGWWGIADRVAMTAPGLAKTIWRPVATNRCRKKGAEVILRRTDLGITENQ